MTTETSQTIIAIAIHTSVIAICRGFFMAIQTIEYTEITCRSMALVAIGPFSFVLSTVNREILRIMVPGGGRPSILTMATRTVCRESCGGVIRRSGVIIRRMASIAGCWGCFRISRIMTSRTIGRNACMCPL
jgi:hypothetical protein